MQSTQRKTVKHQTILYSFVSFLFFVSSLELCHSGSLLASNGSADDHFGFSVSLSGSTGLIGAPRYDTHIFANRGLAYVFDDVNAVSNSTTQNRVLGNSTSGVANARFGWSVSASGTMGLVGTPYSTINSKFHHGTAHVFNNLGVASHSAQLLPSDTGSLFGYSVALSGTTGLVGDGNAIYVFRGLDTASGTVTENAKLQRSAGGGFGSFFSVALSGSTGVVGTSGANSFAGSVTLYRNLDTVTGTVFENAVLAASDSQFGTQLGRSVSIHGNTAVVGAANAAYLYRNLNAAVGTVTQNAKLLSSTGMAASHFGDAVSISGNSAIVGASRENINTTAEGAAYLYLNLHQATGTKTENLKLWASAGTSNNYFGHSVSLDGDNFIVGAYGRSSEQGIAYTGSLSSMTTLDAGNTSKTISWISFSSREHWIVGRNTSNNTVVLSSGNSASINAPGRGVFIGQNEGANNNRLTIVGNLSTNQIIVGSNGNTGNSLQVEWAGSLLNVNRLTVNGGSEVVYNSNSALNIPNITVNGGTLSGTGLSNFDITGNLFVQNGGVVNSGASRIGVSGASRQATITGIHSEWNISGDLVLGGTSLAVSSSGHGSLTINDGASVTVGGSVRVWNGSSINLFVTGNGMLDITGNFTHDGIVGLVAGPLLAPGTYSPIQVGGSSGGTGTFSAIGGTWDATQKQFVVSAAATGDEGQPIVVDISSTQRLLITGDNQQVFITLNPNAENSLGGQNIQFLATENSVTAINDTDVLSAWDFTTDMAYGSETSLTMNIGEGHTASLLRVWYSIDSINWTPYTTSIAYDGNFASIFVNGFSSYAITVVPEPSTALLVLLAGGAWLARRKFQAAKQS